MSRPFSRAFVTGATSGIGWATAELLAAAGCNLILIGRRKQRLEDLRDLIQNRTAPGPSVDVLIAPLDVSDPQQIDQFIAANKQVMSEVDVLINSAGLAKGTDRLMDGKLDHWNAMIDTNLKGLLQITRAVIPFMISANRGHIINLGSVAGRWTYPGGGVYSATKFGVRAISEALRMDLVGTPLRVSNIEPGMVETEFSEVRLDSRERAKAVYRGMKPLTATDIAETILWCLQRPAHVNIQELVIFPTDQAAIQLVHRRDSE
jgi:3-hydroxy acid dehydrogenase / malonic semialdehyde reductase